MMMVVEVVAGEKINMGDMLVFGDDGRVYRARKRREKRFRLSRAHNDALKDGKVKFTMPALAVDWKPIYGSDDQLATGVVQN